MKSFEEWYTNVFDGHISENQATDDLRIAYDYYVENEKLKNNIKGLKYRLLQTAGRRGICLEFDGKDMTDVYELQREIAEKDTIIKFLKKELIHKTCYRQVMKRQYRELKQQMDSDNERHTKMYAELVTKKQSITWHRLEGNPKDLPRNEGWVCNQDGLPCWYDIANDQWIDCEGTQIKTTAWCDMPHTKE